jgi:hypothetical protein
MSVTVTRLLATDEVLALATAEVLGPTTSRSSCRAAAGELV